VSEYWTNIDQKNRVKIRGGYTSNVVILQKLRIVLLDSSAYAIKYKAHTRALTSRANEERSLGSSKALSSVIAML
jgi:hypothetical protein